MKNTFERYPEVILLDATHKTNNLQMPLYVMIAIDGNGESQVVCAFLVYDDTESTLRSMVAIFKNRNLEWKNIEVFITDKDMTERGVIKEEIPQANLQICLFHVLRTFSREVTMEKMGITTGEKVTIKTHIMDIAYARSESDYQEKFKRLCDVMTARVSEYYKKNWHPIRSEWVEGLKQQQFNLCVRTNNRIE